MNFLTHNAIKYTINHLFSIALPNLTLNYDVLISENKVDLILENGDRVIRFYLMSPQHREVLLKHELPANYIKSFDEKVNIPVFPVQNNVDFFITNENELVINIDIITISFLMLSRYEEIIVKQRDVYGRFEYKSSLSFYYNFVDIPIVDEYALLLRNALLMFIPNLNIIKKKGRVFLTHDVDNIRRFGDAKKNLRTIIGGDLFLRKSLNIVYKSIKQLIATRKNIYNDPYIQAIIKLIEISKHKNLQSQFYFLGQIEGENDFRYNLCRPEVKYCIEKIKKENMFIGIHGGFDTSQNETLFKREKKRLEDVVGNEIKIGRQHYLKFDINKTIQIWEKNNIKEDSSLGFYEREGFRCGTCHDYLLYDIIKDQVTSVKEFPLIVMECTLFDYRKLTINEALMQINYLYKRCMAVEGNFVLLWHNGTIDREYEKRFNKVYYGFINNLQS